MAIRLACFIFAVSTFFSQPALAVKIVRLQLEYGGAGQATGGYAFAKVTPVLDLELYDDLAPNTVINYLNYVNSGRYDLTFFNRSIPGFVIQAGGVNNISSDPENETLGPSFGVVPADPPIVNEPGLSNQRGTIAMAKIPNNPDSATSEWFINLDNNSNPLDTDNGGFTVFGRVIDDGMIIADQIASFPITDLSLFFGSAYSDIPFADYDFSGAVYAYQRNLIMIMTAREISRPIMRFSPEKGDFGFVPKSQSLSLDIVLRNTGNEALDIATIDPGSVTQPFTIQSENCSNTTLQPVTDNATSSCVISVVFAPGENGVFNDGIVISYSSQMPPGQSFSVTYPLSGEGAPGPSIIEVPETFNVGVSQASGYSVQNELLITNRGESSLLITNISGLSATGFSQTNDCVGNNISIASGDSCRVTVTFSTDSLGEQSAILTIESNDPANATKTVVVTGYGDSDSDGILASIENAGPNAGDANNDGISDAIQNNVATFKADSYYVTLVAEDAQAAAQLNVAAEAVLTGVQYINAPATGAPVGNFEHGNYQFDINLPSNGITGDAVRMALYYPPGVQPSAYYRYGPTPDNTTPHWYDFSFDETTGTGASFIGKVAIKSSEGNTIERNMVIINFVDGARGDDDLIANGKIVHSAGGIDVNSADASSSGSAAYLYLLSLWLYVLRRATRVKN